MNKFFPEGILFERPENLETIKNPALLNEAAKNQTILEARASLCDFKHDLYVDMPAMKGVIPRASQHGNLRFFEGYYA